MLLAANKEPMLNSILQDASFLVLLLCITGGLFLISLVRIFLLSQQNHRMRRDAAKMEKLAAEQQSDIIATQHDTASWRAKAQRQFDALRAEFTARLDQSVSGTQHAQTQLDESWQQALEDANTRIRDLEVALTAASTQLITQPAIPTLPAIETLRVEALETELAVMKSALVTAQQQNFALKLSSFMARRRQAAPRRAGARTTC
jgi:hypothetical protein